MIYRNGQLQDPIALFTTIAGSFVLVITPSILMWVAILFAVGFDTIVGLIRVVALKEKWQWSKFFGMIVKLMVYTGAFFVVFLLDTIFLKDFILKMIDVEYVLAKSFGLFMIYRELYSSDRSIRLMNSGRGFKYYFKRMMSNASAYKDDIKNVKKDIDDIKKP